MLRQPVIEVILATLLLAFALPAWPASAGGKAEVSYEKPENFTDIGWNPRDRQDTMNSLTEWFNKLAARLPDGQVLRIEVTDIDRAGQVRPDSIHDYRIATGRADWPRIELRYTLLEGSRTVKAGQARIYDLAYLQSWVPPALQRDGLGYEKSMLKKWFDQNFITP